jgi:thiamine-monophosphate kinase
VDFILAECDPRRVGRKALAVNLSDLAAMAALPISAVVSLALPRDGALELAQRLYEGLLPLAEEFDLAIAGGDTNTWEGPLVVSITALGEPAAGGCLTRSGAKPGDEILVTGALGGSILGRHLDFHPRVREAIELHNRYRLHAATDISDGLSLDLSHICEESGCGALLELEAIPLHEDAHRLARDRTDGASALEHALSDGEDFELVLAAPPAETQRMLNEQPLGVPLTRIGRYVAEPGLFALEADGSRRPLTPRGFRH